MGEQEQRREAERYQEWRAEREACEEQQYHIYLEERIAELEAKLERVEGLSEKWRTISYKTTDAYTNLHGCADELKSALGDEDG